MALVPSSIGQSNPGIEAGPFALALSIDAAVGVSSNEPIALPSDTAYSLATYTRAVRISAIDLVESNGGTSIETNLVAGVANSLAIIQVTTDPSSNTDQADGSTLRTLLSGLILDVVTDGLKL